MCDSNRSERLTPYTNAVVQLSGNDGNAFYILGAVKRAIRSSNHPELDEEFLKEAMRGDYDHLLVTCTQYVTVR